MKKIEYKILIENWIIRENLHLFSSLNEVNFYKRLAHKNEIIVFSYISKEETGKTIFNISSLKIETKKAIFISKKPICRTQKIKQRLKNKTISGFAFGQIINEEGLIEHSFYYL